MPHLSRDIPQCHICHVTRVICHMTRVVCHMTRVVCHMTRVICHMTRVICHMTRVVCHMTRVVCHKTRVICHMICYCCLLQALLLTHGFVYAGELAATLVSMLSSFTALVHPACYYLNNVKAWLTDAADRRLVGYQ